MVTQLIKCASTDQVSAYMQLIGIKQKNICGINLKKEFEQLKCSDENLYSKECNKFMLKKELIENKCLNETPEENSSLYPNLNDTNFKL